MNQMSILYACLTSSVRQHYNTNTLEPIRTTCIVVGSIFLAVDDLLRVVKLTINTRTDFVTHRRLEIDKDGTRNVTPRRRFREEGVERIIGNTQRLITDHGSIGGDAVLQTIKLTALISGLKTGMSQVNRDTL